MKNDIKKQVLQQNDFKYDGTYSLYVEKTDHFNFRWITGAEDEGSYEIVNINNKVLASGETAKSRTHSIDLKKEIKAPFTFKFGGKNQGMYEIDIKTDFELEKTNYSKVDSLYVVGDVHGRYDQLVTLLLKSGIIDENLDWIAGQAHIVFLGDIFDRGDDGTKVL